MEHNSTIEQQFAAEASSVSNSTGATDPQEAWLSSNYDVKHKDREVLNWSPGDLKIEVTEAPFRNASAQWHVFLDVPKPTLFWKLNHVVQDNIAGKGPH